MKTTMVTKKTEDTVFSYCDHCGFAIYDAKDAVRVHTTRDVIHSDCWSDYSREHMFEFVEKAEGDLSYDRSG